MQRSGSRSFNSSFLRSDLAPFLPFFLPRPPSLLSLNPCLLNEALYSPLRKRTPIYANFTPFLASSPRIHGRLAAAAAVARRCFRSAFI